MPSSALTSDSVAGLSTKKVQEEFYDSGFNSPGSFGVRVSRGGRKVFFLILPLNGKRRRMSLGTFPVVSLDQARERALSALKQVESGRDPAAEAKLRRRSPETFGKLAERFLSDHAAKRCSPQTMREYRRILDREILPLWENLLLEQITAEVVASAMRRMGELRTNRALANRARALVSSIFSFARRQGLLTENPVVAVPPYREERNPGRILGDDEIRRLWRAASPQTAANIAIRLLLFTGARLGDLLRAKWRDIQFDEWEISTDRRAPRLKVALSPQAMELFRQLRELTSRESDYIFPSRMVAAKTNKPRRSLARELQAAAKQAALNLTARDLRATVRAKLYQLKIRPDVVEYVLGNRSVALRVSRQMPELQYETEARAALILWGRTLARMTGDLGPKKKGDDKVVPLFR